MSRGRTFSTIISSATRAAMYSASASHEANSCSEIATPRRGATWTRTRGSSVAWVIAPRSLSSAPGVALQIRIRLILT